MAFTARTEECFSKALAHSLRSAASDLITSNDLSEAKTTQEALSKAAHSRIMLSISGMSFRIVFILHYLNNAKMQRMIKQAGKEESNLKDSDDVDAYFLEVGNRFCGEAKRLSYEAFDFLGMSTPYVLSQITALSDMHEPNLKFSHHVNFQIQGKSAMAGSIYVYSDGDLVFELDNSMFAEQDGVGELEFF